MVSVQTFNTKISLPSIFPDGAVYKDLLRFVAASLYWQTPLAARLRPRQTTLADGAHPCLLLENKRLALRHDRLGFIIEALPKSTYVFLSMLRRAQTFSKPFFNDVSQC